MRSFLSRPCRCDRVGLVPMESAHVDRVAAAECAPDAGAGGRRGARAAAGGARGAPRVGRAARRARLRLRAPAAPGDAHHSPDGPPARTHYAFSLSSFLIDMLSTLSVKAFTVHSRCLSQAQFSNLVPEYVLFGTDSLAHGMGGTLCTGFWDSQWRFAAHSTSCQC